MLVRHKTVTVEAAFGDCIIKPSRLELAKQQAQPRTVLGKRTSNYDDYWSSFGELQLKPHKSRLQLEKEASERQRH